MALCGSVVKTTSPSCVHRYHLGDLKQPVHGRHAVESGSETSKTTNPEPVKSDNEHRTHLTVREHNLSELKVHSWSKFFICINFRYAKSYMDVQDFLPIFLFLPHCNKLWIIMIPIIFSSSNRGKELGYNFKERHILMFLCILQKMCRKNTSN